MNLRNTIWGLSMFVFLYLCCPVISFSQPPALTAKELMENPSLKDHVKELYDGEIVLLNQPERESASQLDVLMLVMVPAPMNKTVKTLQGQATGDDTSGTLANGEFKASTPDALDQVLAPVMFANDEMPEVEKLLTIDAGDTYNFSRDEIKMIRERAKNLSDAEKDGPAALQAMSKVMRDVLKGRYLAYQKEGMAGLAPYQFSSTKQVDPAAELITATEDLHLVKERFPDYHACLRYYPVKSLPRLVHRYFWVKQRESDRPLFVLKHWILDIQSDYALITERRFYLNHSLSSLQIVIGCLPHDDHTLVVLLNQAFTEKVNMKIGQTIAKAIGHREVEKNIRPIFENLRSALSGNP